MAQEFEEHAERLERFREYLTLRAANTGRASSTGHTSPTSTTMAERR
jgi:hypothetical protein